MLLITVLLENMMGGFFKVGQRFPVTEHLYGHSTLLASKMFGHSSYIPSVHGKFSLKIID